MLHDTGFVLGLKKDLETGIISLKKDAYCDYLHYGDIRRSCLIESAIEENTSPTIAILYDKIMKGDYDKDKVDKIREWVIENINTSKEEPDCIS